VSISFDRVDAGTLYIDICYAVRDTNDVRNLVFPFYAIPGGERAEPVPVEVSPVLLRGA
jgi:hypothetical protein